METMFIQCGFVCLYARIIWTVRHRQFDEVAVPNRDPRKIVHGIQRPLADPFWHERRDRWDLAIVGRRVRFVMTREERDPLFIRAIPGGIGRMGRASVAILDEKVLEVIVCDSREAREYVVFAWRGDSILYKDNSWIDESFLKLMSSVRNWSLCENRSNTITWSERVWEIVPTPFSNLLEISTDDRHRVVRGKTLSSRLIRFRIKIPLRSVDGRQREATRLSRPKTMRKQAGRRN